MTKRPTLPLALLAATFLFSACSRTLRTPVTVEPDIQSKRELYARQFPEDPFVEDIVAGRIEKGMSTLQVKLAWGRPFHSFEQEEPGESKLIYLFADDGLPDSQPKTVTHLFFRHDRLVRWQRDRKIVNLPTSESGIGVADDLGGSSPIGEGKPYQR